MIWPKKTVKTLADENLLFDTNNILACPTITHVLSSAPQITKGELQLSMKQMLSPGFASAGTSPRAPLDVNISRRPTARGRKIAKYSSLPTLLEYEVESVIKSPLYSLESRIKIESTIRHWLELRFIAATLSVLVSSRVLHYPKLPLFVSLDRVTY